MEEPLNVFPKWSLSHRVHRTKKMVMRPIARLRGKLSLLFPINRDKSPKKIKERPYDNLEYHTVIIDPTLVPVSLSSLISPLNFHTGIDSMFFDPVISSITSISFSFISYDTTFLIPNSSGYDNNTSDKISLFF